MHAEERKLLGQQLEHEQWAASTSNALVANTNRLVRILTACQRTKIFVKARASSRKRLQSNCVTSLQLQQQVIASGCSQRQA